MKKITKIIVAILFASAALFATVPAGNVAAAGGPVGESTCKNHFLGLRAWYDGLTEADCSVKSPADDAETKIFVWTIVLNITSMVLGIVGYLAIALVMWGGIQYMLAQGDPGKLAKGKKTITNAVIGIIITMSASIISGAVSEIVSGASKNRTQFFKEIFNKVFLWSGIIAVIMMVYGGVQYVTSTGNPQATAKAKSTILYSAIGLLIVIFAAAIISTVVNGI